LTKTHLLQKVKWEALNLMNIYMYSKFSLILDNENGKHNLPSSFSLSATFVMIFLTIFLWFW